MKKQKLPTLVVIAILTTVTIVFWIIYSLYNSIVSKPVLNIPSGVLDEVSPEIDIPALDKIGQRVFFEEDQIGTLNQSASPSASP